MRRLLTLLAALALLMSSAACTSDGDDVASTDGTQAEGGQPADDEPTDGQDEPTDDDDGDGDEPSGDRDAFVAAAADAMIAEGDFPASRAEAECIAEATVDAVGLEVFEEAGITPEDLDGEEADALIESAMGDHADAIGTAMVTCFDDPVAVFAAAFAEDATPEVQACLEEQLSEEMLITFFTGMLSIAGDPAAEPPPEVQSMMVDLMAACPGMA